MGKHSEWRKLAKKTRRKRIRQNNAKLRDELEEEAQRRRELSPSYKICLEIQTKDEEYQAQEETKLAAERELQWKKVEEVAQIQWQILQKKLEAAKKERARQNEKIKLEWEREQERQKQIKEQENQELMEKLRRQELLTEQTNYFIANGGDTPEHLKVKLETNPKKLPCPFFKKTATCRFYDVCSRNHIRPGISRIILIPGFFTHYSLEATENEHGSDAGLEFENYETYDHYKEFFHDVIPELKTFGKITLFKTCCNHEPHLRGNVYIEYATTRAALKCYQVLNGRWYGGKQLNVEFCNIESWKTAICGLHFVNRCPKGNACNFLHVFQNPQNLYNIYDNDYYKNVRRRSRNSDDPSDRSNWRWSESPERIPSIEWEDREFMSNKHSVRKHKSKSKSRDRSNRSEESYSREKKRSYSRGSRTPMKFKRSGS